MNLGGFPTSDAGDCLRLAVAFMSETDGARLEATFALARAVAGAATTSDDPGVCLTQLEWWRQELERVAGGEPRHPAAQAFVDRVGVDDDIAALTAEWLVDTQRRISGPVPDDHSGHRVAGFRRYGCTLLLAARPEVRATSAPLLRDAGVALYALDAPRDEPVFTYDAAMALHESLTNRARRSAVVGSAVVATTAGEAMRRRYDGLKPGGLRQLLYAWRSARRSAKHALKHGANE